MHSSENFQTSARSEESKDANHGSPVVGASFVLELGEFDSRDSAGVARSARDSMWDASAFFITLRIGQSSLGLLAHTDPYR